MHDFFVLLLLLEDKLVDVLEVLHIIQNALEVAGHVFLQGTKGLYVPFLKSLFRHMDEGASLLDLNDFLKKVDLDSTEDEV
jgi:hypothetical protein